MARFTIENRMAKKKHVATLAEPRVTRAPWLTLNKLLWWRWDWRWRPGRAWCERKIPPAMVAGGDPGGGVRGRMALEHVGESNGVCLHEFRGALRQRIRQLPGSNRVH